jgi:hypothetical protein
MTDSSDYENFLSGALAHAHALLYRHGGDPEECRADRDELKQQLRWALIYAEKLEEYWPTPIR